MEIMVFRWWNIYLHLLRINILYRHQEGLHCKLKNTSLLHWKQFLPPEILSERQKERLYFFGMCVPFLRRCRCDKSFYYQAQTPQKGFAVDFHYIILNRNSLVQKSKTGGKKLHLSVGNRTQLLTSVHRPFSIPYLDLFLIALLHEMKSASQWGVYWMEKACEASVM